MKKRLLAGLLSFTMLTAQVLPVVAADDADVTVSEDVYAEEETEEAAEETELYDIELEEEEVGDVDDLEEGEYFYDIAASEDDVIIDEYSVDMDVPSYIFTDDSSEKVIIANATIQGNAYDLSTTVVYDTKISYRARKIKPYEDLGARVTSSGLNNLVQELATGSGDISSIIQWKFKAKKNVNAASDSFFTVKASVNKSLAKNAGITGKSLKTLNKAVKAFNKAAKAKTSRLGFMIVPINVDQMRAEKGITAVGKYTGWFFATEFAGYSHMRGRLEPDQPDSVSSSTYKNWTKLSKKDFKVKKVKGQAKTYNVEPKGKNFYGNSYTIKFN